MQLSKHFKLEEFTRSQIAARNNLKNIPGSGEVKNLENICYEILEPVRAKFGKPIMIKDTSIWWNAKKVTVQLALKIKWIK